MAHLRDSVLVGLTRKDKGGHRNRTQTNQFPATCLRLGREELMTKAFGQEMRECERRAPGTLRNFARLPAQARVSNPYKKKNVR
jgi:hypothetical protein